MYHRTLVVLTGETSPDNRSIFPIHATDTAGNTRSDDLTAPGSFLANGDLDLSTLELTIQTLTYPQAVKMTIAQNRSDIPVGPVEISIIRGSETSNSRSCWWFFSN